MNTYPFCSHCGANNGEMDRLAKRAQAALDQRDEAVARAEEAESKVEWWKEWSNEVAEELPERYDGDEAQESLILKAVRDLRARAEAAEARLAQVLELCQTVSFSSNPMDYVHAMPAIENLAAGGVVPDPPPVCVNCGKPMSKHGPMANCEARPETARLLLPEGE